MLLVLILTTQTKNIYSIYYFCFGMIFGLTNVNIKYAKKSETLACFNHEIKEKQNKTSC